MLQSRLGSYGPALQGYVLVLSCLDRAVPHRSGDLDVNYSFVQDAAAEFRRQRAATILWQNQGLVLSALLPLPCAACHCLAVWPLLA